MSQACSCGCGHGAGAATAMAGAAGGALAPGDTVEAVTKRVPDALPVLRELGIDTCCGGSLTLAEAAASAGIPVDRVLEALRKAQ